uniref:DUF4211 domain-containing protein n=1 Tax=Panagrellus redivivus TaxID=6233 RepID=A0A7E4V9I8_PANRE
MDQHNTSSHPLIPPNFASAATGFPTQLTAGLHNAGSNVSNNPLLSTLQQLGLSTNTGLLQPQSSLNTPLTNDFSNWNNSQTSAWLDQAKMAMYNSMLQSTVNERQYDIMEQSFKAAAAAARAPPSLSSALNLATQHANVNAFTHATDPIMAAVVAAAANPLPNMSKSIFNSVPVPEAITTAPMTSFPTVNTNMNVNMNMNMNGLGASGSAFNSNDNFSNSLFAPSSSMGASSSSMSSMTQPSTSNAHFMNVITPAPSKSSAMDAFKVTDLLSYHPQQQHLQQQSEKMFSPVPCSTNQLLDNLNLVQHTMNQTQSHAMSASQTHQTAPQQPVQLQQQHTPLPDQTITTHVHSLPSTSNTKDVTLDDLYSLRDIFPFKEAAVSSESSIFPQPISQQPVTQSSSSSSLAQPPPAPKPPPPQPPPPKNREMDSDKELNHWLSLAVGGNLPDDEHDQHGSPLSNFGDVPADNMDLFTTETTGFSLDPIMFTPPDSPTHEAPKTAPARPAMLNNDKIPTKSKEALPANNINQPGPSESRKPEPAPKLPIIDPSAFLMPKSKDSKDNERIPIYKRKTFESKSSCLDLEKVLSKVTKKKNTDLYSFTDDEDDDILKPTPLPLAALDTSDEDIKKSSAAEDVKPVVTVDPVESSPTKKRASASAPSAAAKDVDRQGDTAQTEVVFNNLAKIIKKRYELARDLPHVLAFCEILDDGNDDAITVNQPEKKETAENVKQAETVTAMLKPKEEVVDVNETQPIKQPASSSPSVSPPVLPINEPIPAASDEKMDIEQPKAVVIKQEIDDEAPPRPVIPKLVIRLPRRDSVQSPVPKKKKKHKKHRGEPDEDWEPPEKQHKKKKHKHKRDADGNKIRQRSVEKEPSANIAPPTLTVIQPNTEILEKPVVTAIKPVENAENEALEFVKKRLECLSRPSGDSPKGTFVVCKQDALKSDCPLWKVDNQNLLQKYPQIVTTVGKKKVLRYKNSSTYSGWCDQVAAGYITVKVKYHKHSRNETIVEPEVPIIDLIPAMAVTVTGQDAFGQPEDTEADDVVENFTTAAKDAVRDHMKTFTHAMLKHAATLGFLQTVKECNDWSYMCALREVESMTALGKQRINDRVKWGQRFEVMLTVYPNALSSECLYEDQNCQGCAKKPATKGLQLFANWGYNYDSLEVEKLPDMDGEPPLVAIEFYLCNQCSHLSLMYHRLHHMKFTTLRYCEEMLENVSTLRPELTVEGVIAHCMNRRSWQKKLINDYVALWRKVQQNDL